MPSCIQYKNVFVFRINRLQVYLFKAIFMSFQFNLQIKASRDNCSYMVWEAICMESGKGIRIILFKKNS